MNIYIKTAITTTTIFVIGILLGLTLSSEKVSQLESDMYDLQENMESVELQFMFLETMEEDISCESLSKEALFLGSETQALAKQVELYESTAKLDETEFKQLKSEYMLTLIKDWLFLEKIKQNCDSEYITVVYFYSNTYCADCEEQGVFLSYFKSKLDENLQVFSIDTDLDLRIISSIEASYNITEYPSLIINGNRYEGLMDKEQLTEIFCANQPELNIC